MQVRIQSRKNRHRLMLQNVRNQKKSGVKAGQGEHRWKHFSSFSGVHEGSCISTLGVMSSEEMLPGTTRRFILHMSLRLSLSVCTNFLATHCRHKCGKRSESVRCFERADSGPISRTSMTPHRVLETFFRMRCKFPMSIQSSSSSSKAF